jgi:hypothetical protein
MVKVPSHCFGCIQIGCTDGFCKQGSDHAQRSIAHWLHSSGIASTHRSLPLATGDRISLDAPGRARDRVAYGSVIIAYCSCVRFRNRPPLPVSMACSSICAASCVSSAPPRRPRSAEQKAVGKPKKSYARWMISRESRLPCSCCWPWPTVSGRLLLRASAPPRSAGTMRSTSQPYVDEQSP